MEPGVTAWNPAFCKELACRKTSPDPSAISTKPKPFSELYHFTVALASGAEDEDPNPEKDGGGGGLLPKKLSSSQPRRRGCRWRSFFGGRTIKPVLMQSFKSPGTRRVRLA